MSTLAAALGWPVLPAAACRGMWAVFDDVIDGRRAAAQREALTICRSCPELGPCRDWFDSLPARRKPYSVTAGQIRKIRDEAA